MGLPSINITFSALASSAIKRSKRGIVCLVVSDTTKATVLATYSSLAGVSSSDYTAQNYNAIKDAFRDGAPKVYVVRIGSGADFEDVTATIDTLAFNWIAYISSDGQADLVTYVKARNTANPNKQIKAVVYNATTPADKHIVNFANATVTRLGETTATDSYLFLGRLAGLFAALPFTRSATYYTFDDLASVAEPADVDAAITAGKLVIINDYGTPKIARAVNSMTTPGTGENATMKKITIVEAMDLMKEDIASTFESDYIGKYKNNLDNQQTFLAAINHYFDKLAEEDILDNAFDNSAGIDVAAQRSALIDAGHTEAVDWDDLTVKRNTVGSTMYLSGNVKILDAIEDLTFGISMA